MGMFEDEYKRKDVQEILRLAGVLDTIDEDVADLCIKLMPKEKDHLISMAELMEGVQKIKNTLNSKTEGDKDA